MGFFYDIWAKIAGLEGKSIQSTTQSQRYRDYDLKGESYSVECDISEALADLMLMLSSMPISGETERAKWLDEVSDNFFRDKAKTVVASAFETGDCLIIPSWTGRNIQNVVVNADDFEVLETVGDEITAAAYLLDTVTKNNQEYRLYQAIELKPYQTDTGETLYSNNYRLFVARNGSIVSGGLDLFPKWGNYAKGWAIPNVDRLLIGRFRSFTINPNDLNSVKGVPICFGAGKHINEIHYLLDQMHEEFGMSEKAIIASKSLFKKDWKDGKATPTLPSGKERLFMALGGQNANSELLEEWSPDIRYLAYLEDIDKQEKLVERAVGVSQGIISISEEKIYNNVDNVRKSQQKTMGFISTARKQAESCLLDLVYAWDKIANYYEINPIGDYDVSFDWSNEYIETFADRREAILAGNAIGATDAVDYRQFIFDESPEAAKDRVAEIAAAKSEQSTMIEEVGNE